MPTEGDCREVLSLPEFEELARQSMTPMAYAYVASGAAEEHTVRWNREAFDRIRLRPRVLRDVASIDTRVTAASWRFQACWHRRPNSGSSIRMGSWKRRVAQQRPGSPTS